MKLVVSPARRNLDKRITEIIGRRCAGLPINVLDIERVFQAGYAAAREDNDLEHAIVDSYTRLSADATQRRK